MIFGYVLMGAIALIGWFLRAQFRKKIKEYNSIPLQNPITGHHAAELMLRDNNIFDVKIIRKKGILTDHYNPVTKTISLSEEVYFGTSTASIAVATHECGHALQHAKRYNWLELRSRLVPFVQISSQICQWVLLIGILFMQLFPILLPLGISLFALTVLFSFITLPVEYDASERGLNWIKEKKILNSRESLEVKDALNLAAQTYVVVALSSLATLIYYIIIFVSRR